MFKAINRYKTFIIPAFTFFLCNHAFANKDFILGIMPHTGGIVPHHESIDYNLEDYIGGFEINFLKWAKGKNYWEYLYNYPYYGVGYFQSNMGNNNVYGNVKALYAFMDVPFIRPMPRFKWNYQLALGLSYLSEHFHLNANYYNQAIGSHLNCYIRIGSTIEYQLTNHIYAVGQVSGFHVSSGKITSPNLGLNALTVSAGVRYHFNAELYEQKQPEKSIEQKKWHYQVLLSGGIKSPTDFTTNKYFISTGLLEVCRNIGLKHQIGLGADLFYDPSAREITEELRKEWKHENRFTAGLHIAHNQVFNKLIWPIHIGYYLITGPDKITPTYFRTGLRYYVTEHFMLGLSIKSHNFTADYFEWNIGLSF